MRILLVNQFYPPDMAPTGRYLHDLAAHLVSRGHEVEALCSRTSYKGGGRYLPEEVCDGVRVHRPRTLGFGRLGAARAADYLSFLFGASWRAVSSRDHYDLTVCLTTPPYLGWVMPRLLGRRGGASVQWVMDLYPDVLLAHGTLPPLRLTTSSLRRLTTRQLSGSALVLTLGQRMQQRVRSYAGGRTRLECVPLWSMLPRTRKRWRRGDVSGDGCATS